MVSDPQRPRKPSSEVVAREEDSFNQAGGFDLRGSKEESQGSTQRRENDDETSSRFCRDGERDEFSEIQQEVEW